ncbi:glyoxalase [Citrobacter amalonaticus]|uniref:glyoxalase n=1 Tax=Citrobacter amalonaticus TaxID=35703 RepID=UPI001907F4B8|nr:glyoxalase [Citrobacter amalonaticus]MBJ9258268.1 glyoxalase [Citrobacter amalonaticus]
MFSIPKGINVLFVAGFSPVTKNKDESAALYKDILRLPLETIDGYDGYLQSQNIPGVKYFAVWPLDKVALSCFGSSEWPDKFPVPQAWIEFDVDDIQSASEILKESGCQLLTCMQEEPWEQTVTRFLSPEGIIMAISYTPFLRKVSEQE